MYLIYIDEAGNTGLRKDPDQPYHLIGAVLVPDRLVEPLADGLQEIVSRRFPDIWWQDGFEIHGADIFGGQGLFKSEKPDQRIGACTDIADLLVRQEIELIWVAIDKMKSYASEHPHGLAFKYVSERVQDRLRLKNELGLFVADGNKEMEQKLITDLRRYKKLSTAFGYRPTKLDNVIDSVHFVQSINNPIIQIADIFSYFICKSIRVRDGILAAYRAEPAPQLSWIDFNKISPSKPALRAVLDIADRFATRVVASKRWPT